MALHEVLAETRSEVLYRWTRRVQGSLAPESMPPLELIDHLPQFVDEVIATLEDDRSVASEERCDHGATAAIHGEHRLRQGFSLDSVVREYGALQAVLIATAREAGAGAGPPGGLIFFA